MQFLPFDPLERAKEIENIVMQDLKRKYYRFRASSYYGGIVTADTVGCCFLCAYCWNYSRNLEPEKYGKFYPPKEVANNLVNILKKRKFSRVRISGAEPILGEKSFEHCLSVFKEIRKSTGEAELILETNGLLFGVEEEFSKRLHNLPRLMVRVTLKGYDPESFEKITGADRKFFELPLQGLKNLLDEGVYAWPAVMYEIFGSKGIEKVNRKLREFGIKPEELELEYLERYSFAMKNLKKRSVKLYE